MIHALKVRVTRQRRVYVGRYRLHHGAFGVALTIFGTLMAYHDRRDWPFPFIDRT